MNVLLADDRAKVRSALRLLLEQEPDIQIVGEAADATGLLLAVERDAPDLILLDWELPGLPPENLLRLLRYLRPTIWVIALSGRPEARPAALAAGIDGFVSKGDPPEQVLTAMRMLRSNGVAPTDTTATEGDGDAGHSDTGHNREA